MEIDLFNGKPSLIDLYQLALNSKNEIIKTYLKSEDFCIDMPSALAPSS